jgi:anti-sigma regulatory factor (Ser/Thr protein kinase)
MEPIKDARVIAITEPTQIAIARRAAADLCRRLGLTDDTVARAEIIAVELAGNILQHAERGTLAVASLPSGSGVHILASDLGPGLGDVARAMSDGFSTSSTPGLGLGAVGRLVSSMDIYSRQGGGTAITATLREARFRAGSAAAETARLQDEFIAVLSTPIEGERLNGDSWALYPAPDRDVYLMVDGLGHGSYAAEAAAVAVGVANSNFGADPSISLAAVIQRMHVPMQATRGAAVMLVSVQGSQVLCCGVGNIGASLCQADGTLRSLVSHNGTVGHRMARVQEFEYAAPPGTLLIMHSDGISTRWKLSGYPGLHAHAPATIATVLNRDSARIRDDSSILVSRLGVSGIGVRHGATSGDTTVG